MNSIQLPFSKQSVSIRLLALAALVALSTTLGIAPTVIAQSSTVGGSGSSNSAPSQGSGSSATSQGSGTSTPSQGSGSTIPSNGSGSTLPSQGSGSTTPSNGSGSTLPGQGSGSSSYSTIPNQGSNKRGDNEPADQNSITYFQIVMAIQKNESEINRLYSSMPIGAPEKIGVQMNKIEELKVKNQKLAKLLDIAAVRAYQKDPEKNSKAGKLIYRQMLQKMDPHGFEHHFDPQGALEIANILIEGGLDNENTPGAVQFKNVAYQAFRASYAIQDFSRADLMLKKIADQGIRIRSVISKKLENTREKWQRELKIRRLEGLTNDLPKVKFETTEGTFLVELFENNAPATVGNFIDLVEKNFYDDMPFFLVKPGEIVQTGCPNGNGTGDAGYFIPCECEREQIRHHFTGTLSMAHKGERNTGGSQFFISHQPNQKWDGRYTAFGRVKKGMDVIYRLQTVDKTVADPAEIEPSRIIKATVVSKRDHKYEATRIEKSEIEAQPQDDPAEFLEQLQESANSGG